MGPLKQAFDSRDSEGSIYRILRVFEAPRGSFVRILRAREGSMKLQEVQILTGLTPRVGPLEETLDSGGSEGSMSGGSKRSRF